MLDNLELRHIAAFLSPFAGGDDGAMSSHFASGTIDLGLPMQGEPILVASESQPDFELARHRLLDEAV